MKPKTFIDFRGGYHTDTPPSLMRENEMQACENLQWRDGLVKRNGIRRYSSTTFTGSLKGGIATYLNSNYKTILAQDDGAATTFFHGNADTFTSLSVNFTTGKGKVYFTDVNQQVVAANGFDDPIVITNTGSWTVETIDAKDARDLDNIDWWAGQWDDGAATECVDDTADAQSTTASDYNLATTTNNDGFYVASDFTFNKITMYGSEQFGGSPVAEYRYSKDDETWDTLTLTTTPTWTDAEANKDMVFTVPSDWGRATSDMVDDANATGRYVIRVRFTTAPSGAADCDYLSLHHTKKFTEITDGEKANYLVTHKNRCFMSFENSVLVYYSPPNVVTGWRIDEVEYFLEGGETVTGLISFRDYLVVFKENAMYGYFGDSFANFRREKLSDIGTISHRSAAVVGDYLIRVAYDGIYAFDGERDVKVSKHIQTDFDTLSGNQAAAVEYQNEYWVAFPINNVILTMDPDTIRKDDAGDFIGAFYKFTGTGDVRVEQFIKRLGTYDTGILQGLCNKPAAPYLSRVDNGADDDSSTAISTDFQTAYLFNNGHIHRHRRFKVVLNEVATTTASAHTLSFHADYGDRTATTTLTVSKGSSYETHEVTMPYAIDGHNVSVRIQNGTNFSCGILQFSLDYENRRF